MHKSNRQRKNSRSPTGKAAADIGGSPSQVREKIITTLNNPKFKARTISGISKEAHLEKAVIVRALKSDRSLKNTVKVAAVRTTDGRILITTKERFLKESSLKEKFVDFFASKRVEIDDAE